MKNILMVVTLVALTAISCERSDRADHNRTDKNSSTRYEEDNTGVNVRDRDNRNVTSDDQSESEDDRIITQRIRKAIINNDELSSNAKNIKIITIDRRVVLRGPVNSASERTEIENTVKNVDGIKNIDNQLEVVRG